MIAFQQCYGCGSKHVKRREERLGGAVLYYEAQCLACGGICSAETEAELESRWISKRWSFAPSGPVKSDAEISALYREKVPSVADVLADSERKAEEKRRFAAENAANLKKGVIDNNMTPFHLSERSGGKFAERMAAAGYRVGGGIDWLELFMVGDLLEDWANIEKTFSRAKAAAKDSGTEEKFQPVPGVTFRMQEYGPRIAKMPYPFRCFDQFGIVWLFRDKPEFNEKVPPVRIRIPGEACLLAPQGVYGLVQHIKRTLAGLKAGVVKLGVSRVDLCVDVAGMGVEEFHGPHFDECYATRVRSRSGEKSKVQGDCPDSIDPETWKYLKGNGYTFYHGRNPATLRVYNKLAEVGHKMNPKKWQAMIVRRWGGVIPEKATRIEFELRREWLRGKGIDSVDDLFSKRAALVEYLTHKWFRYTTRTRRGENNTHRLETLPQWSRVQDVFAAVFSGGVDHDLTAIEKAECDVSALDKQALGVLLKSAECLGENHGSYSEFIESVAVRLWHLAQAKRPDWIPLNQEFEKHELM